MNNFAPIVLFVYSRPLHAEKTLNALIQNELASESVLYIYCDGPKENSSIEERKNINNLRLLVRSKQWCGEVKIIESEKNKGLANSIIDGVTEVSSKYGKVIVLEDDIVTSKGFLKYMNQALIIYEDDERVMHVSGYIYPVKGKKLPETFFYNVNSCWGWGTWNRAWILFYKDSIKVKEALLAKDNFSQDNFNKGQGRAFWKQIEDNISGKINTWAVYWHSILFLNDGFSLHPHKSLVRNIGMDNSGDNCGVDSRYNDQDIVEYVDVKPIPVVENKYIIRYMSTYFNDPSLKKRVLRTLRKLKKK